MMTPAQCRAARALLDWSQQRLADEATVGNAIIRDFEGEKSAPLNATLQMLRTALEAAGVMFLAENGEGPGVRFKKGHTSAGPLRSSSAEMIASAGAVRSRAADAADEAMSGMDATKDAKDDRRRALTDEPADVAHAKSRLPRREDPEGAS
jgi:transcriptional regulator with XRE-family HTH domain